MLLLDKIMHWLMQEKQLEIVDNILQAVDEPHYGEKKYFPNIGKYWLGQTVRTAYLCKRKKHPHGETHEVKCTAFNGAVSNLLSFGQMTHQTFGLKAPLS